VPALFHLAPTGAGPKLTNCRQGIAWWTSLLVALVSLVTLLGVGGVRRCRWIFWLILIVFLAGVLRMLVVVMQLMGVLAADGPAGVRPSQGCRASFPLSL
jgi:hypothetical protein